MKPNIQITASRQQAACFSSSYSVLSFSLFNLCVSVYSGWLVHTMEWTFFWTTLFLFYFFNGSCAQRLCEQPCSHYLLGISRQLSITLLHPTEWPDVSHELRRKRLGIHATIGGRNWRRTGYRPVITSVIIGNVKSLYNKVDESQAVGDLQ